MDNINQKLNVIVMKDDSLTGSLHVPSIDIVFVCLEMLFYFIALPRIVL